MSSRNGAIRAGVIFCLLVLIAGPLQAQHAELRPASPIRLPGISDSNSPVIRGDKQFIIYQSLGLPLYVEGESQTSQLKVRSVFLTSYQNVPLWIEAVWVDDDGTVYAWYHHEEWLCKNNLASPVIGALVSHDGGKVFDDLGVVIQTSYPLDCSSKNGFFSGGQGDFTVLLDRTRQFFYFYFSNYSGPLEAQGVVVARMPFGARARPVGQVRKFYNGSWSEPGLKGRVTSILPARVSWVQENADSYWGPSIHWNTYLQQYVMLLNRSCCSTGFPPEGIYVSFNPDLSVPNGWSAPEKILEGEHSRWYPQVIGRAPNGTDRQAGRVARFYMNGDSDYEIVFSQ